MKACIHISMMFLLFIHQVLMCTVVQVGSFCTLYSLSVQQHLTLGTKQFVDIQIVTCVLVARIFDAWKS